MWPDRVSNPGPLTYESGVLPTTLRDPAILLSITNRPYGHKTELNASGVKFRFVAVGSACSYFNVFFTLADMATEIMIIISTLLQRLYILVLLECPDK